MPPHTFIEKHGLWTDDQTRLAEELKQRVRSDNLRLVRLAWADPHGCSRAKAVTVPTFVDALVSGYDIGVATSTLDSANARVFDSFVRRGIHGLDEMSGSPNITIVPEPSTFRMLPWAPGTGWILCTEYFNSGAAYPFSPRHILRRQLQKLRERGMDFTVGLEVECYLARIAEDHLTEEHLSTAGTRGRPQTTWAVEPGYSYHSESNLDRMEPVLSELAETCATIGLPLRSLENELGPGQLECTFSPQMALEAADEMLLFRTAAKQVCLWLGYLMSFMCRPALKGYCPSGWHLHQSLTDAELGSNLFASEVPGEMLTPLGSQFVGGLLKNAAASTAFTTPTVNGYRRFKPNSLAPERAGWGYDNRGTMIRVVGSPGPATRIENRAGEPSANPYLYFASQIVSGLYGVDHATDPGPPDEDPYKAKRPMLPRNLTQALDALENDELFRKSFGDLFVDYFVKFKRSEAGRFLKYLEETGVVVLSDEPTDWEQNEYFDFF